MMALEKILYDLYSYLQPLYHVVMWSQFWYSATSSHLQLFAASFTHMIAIATFFASFQ